MRKIVSGTVLSFVMLFALTLLTALFMGCDSPAGGEDPVLTGTAAVTGTARVEETLTADTGALGGSGDISFKWQRGDSADGAFTDIDGAAGQAYTLTAADQGKYIRVTVSRAGNTGTVSSPAVGPVTPVLPGSAEITIGFNYGEITITGSDGANIIYKSTGRSPNSITLSASGYTGVNWYIDGNGTAAGSENSITLNAGDYSAKTHSITFTGTTGGALYSRELPFTVKN
jgi:hypothetical protein